MKKVLTVLAVLVLVCASVFAANEFAVRGSICPLEFNGLYYSSEGESESLVWPSIITEKFESFGYGINLNADFDYYVTDNIRVGAQVESSIYFSKNEEYPVCPAFVAFFAKAGYTYPLNSQWAIAADLGLGLVKTTAAFKGYPVMFGMDLQLTGAYSFNEKLALTFGGQFSAAFMSEEEYYYSLFGFGPIVGVEYKF